MAHKITYRDIVNIISTAKTTAATQFLPMVVTGQLVTGYDPAQVAMIETVIGYLNSKGLLKEVPEVDHKERL